MRGRWRKKLLDDDTGVGAVMLRQIVSTVLVSGYQLVSSVYRCRLYLAICILRLAPDLPERNYCLNRRVSVGYFYHFRSHSPTLEREASRPNSADATCNVRYDIL